MVCRAGGRHALPPAWIFQASPQIYDIDRALRHCRRSNGPCASIGSEFTRATCVYLAGGLEAGIIAVGSVASEPAESAPIPRRTVSSEPEELSKVEPRVRTRIERVLDEPLLRSTLQEDLRSQNLGILRFANATVHEVTPDEDARLRELVGEDGPAAARVQRPSFASIAEAIEAAGMTIDERTLRRYHLSLKTRGFVVLSGISGTGKTWLAEAYAHAVGAQAAGRPGRAELDDQRGPARLPQPARRQLPRHRVQPLPTQAAATSTTRRTRQGERHGRST